MSQQRLDKIIASQGKYSRSDVKRLARSGDITVNGRPVSDCGMKVDPEKDSISVCGEVFGYSRFVYIMLNKPEGVVSASRSPGDKTVVDLVPDELYRDGLFPAGRLDKDTTGFVLITDDGAFAHEILSPKKHIEKTYVAQLDRPIGDAEFKKFRSGITLADGYECLPAGIKVLSDDGLIVEIKLREGKYHQIKRMAAACGSHVNKLHRVSMGGLELDNSLAPGECRLLDESELKRIRSKISGEIKS